MFENTQEWFESWFDTEYYHILYKNRDDSEAHLFMDNICKALKLSLGTKILDLACGKGRHSKYLAQKGFDVTGVDLSANSINTAKASENEMLHFHKKDMRENLGQGEYNVVMNLFTSFGYFDDPTDNVKVLKAIKNSLKTDGIAVIDYFNAQKAISALPFSETKEINGLQFEISKKLINDKIIKKIIVNDFGHKSEYYEKVSAFMTIDFKSMFAESGLKIIDHFGDYQLNAFSEQSDRNIFVLKAI